VKKYSDALPAKGSFRTCCALDSDGNRCRKMSMVRDYFFGNPEFDNKLSWVVVWLCREHWEAYRPYDKWEDI